MYSMVTGVGRRTELDNAVLSPWVKVKQPYVLWY